MDHSYIEIRGARENNLKNLSLKIPKQKITVFTGVSGSGKSSIVFDTIAQEAGRQLNETFSKFVQIYLPKHGHPDVDEIRNLSFAVAIEQKKIGGNSRSTLGTITDINPLLRLLFSRAGTPFIGPSNYFSFNDPNGMCPTCEGLGKIITLDLSKALDPEKSLSEGAILLPGYKPGGWQWKVYADSGFFDRDKKIKDYTPEEYENLVYKKPLKMNSTLVPGMNTTYMGLVEKYISSNVKTEYEKSEATKRKMEAFSVEARCTDCEGKRYNARALSVKVAGKTIHELTALQVDRLLEFVETLTLPEVQPILQNLKERLGDLIAIGLDYVSLDRETSTLSGGESQRVKMVKHLTSSLTDTIYILDEPSIGLHVRDVHRLNELLVKLRDKGNTVLVVEHDPDVIKVADHIIDVGPRAGTQGGNIVFTGSYQELLQASTLTGEILNRHLPIKPTSRRPGEFYETPPSRLHNLKDARLRIPKGLLTVVTGVAGSGKSSLVHGVFAETFPQAVLIDQSPVGANARSNPATYTGILDIIRKLFSEATGAPVGMFTSNSEGACETCKGRGVLETELSFMDSVETLCEACGGKRFKPEALSFRLQGKNIVEVMNMTMEEAEVFFADKEINKKLKHLVEVGLSYMTLGQPLDTLSGGECQRIKLATELGRKGNLYILDEPTTGLHMSDITGILQIMEKLVDRGNTVVVIEHNLDIIRQGDWIIDVGPEGGHRGGEILYEGPPAGLKSCERSITGRYI